MYTLEGCETAAQVAEEAKRAEFLAPLAVVGSIVGSWFIGLAYMLALLFSVQSISSVQATSYAIPIAQLYYDAVGRRLTLMCLTIIMLAQFMAAVTAFTASSRLFYALARDNAFPMKTSFMALNRYQAPYTGVWLSVFVGCVISCAYIGSAIAVRKLVCDCRISLIHSSVQCNSVFCSYRCHAELPPAYPHPHGLAVNFVSGSTVRRMTFPAKHVHSLRMRGPFDLGRYSWPVNVASSAVGTQSGCTEGYVAD